MSAEAIRCEPEHAEIASLPSLRGLPERVAQRKFELVKRGVKLKDELQLFPEQRTHRDALCTVTFVGSFLLFLALGISSRAQPGSASALLPAPPFGLRQEGPTGLYIDAARRLTSQEDRVSWNVLLSVVTVSSAVGFLCALVVLQLLQSGGEQVLFQCTMLLPVLRLITGLFCLCYPWNNFTPQTYYRGMDDDAIRYLACAVYTLAGASLTICSLCNCCISMHVRHLARPWLSLQASLMKCVSMVVLANPGMLLVPLGFAVLLYFCIVGCISAWSSILDAATVSSWWPETAIIPTILLIGWGGGVASYTSILAFCGVYSRWYHSRPEPPVFASLRSAVAFGLGTACLASFLRPTFRTIELLSRIIQPSGPDCKANPVRACMTCTCACVLEFAFRLVGDVSRFFDTWAFTQCAIRNGSFFQSSYITFALCTCSNVTLLTRNLVLDYVTGSGTQAGGLLGLLVGAVAHYLGKFPWLYWAPATGCICATIMTSIVLSVAKTGFKSILALWAESCQLQQLSPETHAAIVSCIKKRLEEEGQRHRTVSEMSQLSR